jgi:hypothetical protein
MPTPICNILFVLIIIILALIIFSFFIEMKEGFFSNRENKLKIYKSYEIKDPDETPELADINDPDSNPITYDID